MTVENDDWKNLMIQDQLISKDREIDVLFELLKVKDEQISKYQENYHSLTASVKNLSEGISKKTLTAVGTSRAPWALASLAAVMFFVLSVSYLKMRNEFTVVGNESVYLSERLDIQRDGLAEKAATISHQQLQLAELDTQKKLSTQEMAQAIRTITLLENEKQLLQDQVIEQQAPEIEQLDIATE